MLDLEGSGVLALWNGVDPARRPEYDLWHSREHVPERISVPGMLGARRYARIDGLLPLYLTLYALESVGMLGSAPYRRLLDNPTPWSKSMRPSFRGFARLACERRWSAGGGLGGWLAALPLDEACAAAWQEIAGEVARLPDEAGVVAAHILLRDAAIPDVPFSIGGETPDFPRAGALMLEFFDDPLALGCLPSVSERLEQAGAGQLAAHLTLYRLAYALDRRSLQNLLPPPPRA